MEIHNTNAWETAGNEFMTTLILSHANLDSHTPCKRSHCNFEGRGNGTVTVQRTTERHCSSAWYRRHIIFRLYFYNERRELITMYTVYTPEDQWSMWRLPVDMEWWRFSSCWVCYQVKLSRREPSPFINLLICAQNLTALKPCLRGTCYRHTHIQI